MIRNPTTPGPVTDTNMFNSEDHPMISDRDALGSLIGAVIRQAIYDYQAYPHFKKKWRRRPRTSKKHYLDKLRHYHDSAERYLFGGLMEQDLSAFGLEGAARKIHEMAKMGLIESTKLYNRRYSFRRNNDL